MITTTRQTKAAEIERTLSVAWNNEAGCVEATVCETHHKKTKSRIESFTSYFLRPIAADFGSAYEIEKRFAAGEVYHVHADRQRLSCDCPAGAYRGGCRHIQAVRQAIADKLL